MWISRVRVVFSFVPPVDNFVDNLLVVIHISTGGILLYELSTGYPQDIHRFINMTFFVLPGRVIVHFCVVPGLLLALVFVLSLRARKTNFLRN